MPHVLEANGKHSSDMRNMGVQEKNQSEPENYQHTNQHTHTQDCRRR